MREKFEEFKVWFQTGYNKWYFIGGVSLAIGLLGFIL